MSLALVPPEAAETGAAAVATPYQVLPGQMTWQLKILTWLFDVVVCVW